VLQAAETHETRRKVQDQHRSIRDSQVWVESLNLNVGLSPYLESTRAKILWNFQIQTENLAMANQHYVGRQTKEKDGSDRCSNSINKKEHEKLKKNTKD